MKRINLVKALSALALTLAASASHAEYVKFEFTGHATSADFHGDNAISFPSTNPGNVLNASSLITGYFYYDLATPLTYSGNDGLGTSYGTYLNSTASINIKFSSNGFQSAPNDNTVDYMPRVDITNTTSANGQDQVQIYGRENTAFGAIQDTTLDLKDKNGTTLSSTALPSSLSLSDYDGVLNFYWTDSINNRSFEFNATLDTLKQVAAVPEPETYAMLLAGLALMGVARRRRELPGC